MSAGSGQIDSGMLCLECLGLTVGRFVVPHFRLYRGESVCLHIGPTDDDWYEQMLPVLTGKRSHPSFRIHRSIASLERPVPRRRWFRRPKYTSAQDWLIRDKGLTAAEANGILDRLSIPPAAWVEWQGWKERTLLALEACLLRPPDVLVIDTAGNGPDSIQMMFERLTARPSGLALLYLKNLTIPPLACLPDARCLEITTPVLQTANVE
jgi:hypothetical protein